MKLGHEISASEFPSHFERFENAIAPSFGTAVFHWLRPHRLAGNVCMVHRRGHRVLPYQQRLVVIVGGELGAI
jgi:hypothetical protein